MEVSSKARLVAWMLACYDPRLNEDRESLREALGLSEYAVEAALRELRNAPPEETWPQHIRDIRVLGLKTLVAEAEPLRVEAREIDDIASVVPAHRYLYSYRVTMDNRAYYSYIVPVELEDKLYSEITEGLRGLRSVDIGWTTPIRAPCSPPSGDPRDEIAAAKALEEEYAALLKPPSRIKYGIVELMLYSILDLNPLASKPEILDATWAVRERLGRSMPNVRVRLVKSKAMQAYEKLSRQRLIGRALLHKVHWQPPMLQSLVSLYVTTDAACAPRLYALASRLRLAASVFAGESTAATVMVAPDQLLEDIRRSLGGCSARTGAITYGFGTVLPFDMYHPLHGWRMEPYPLLEILKGKKIVTVSEEAVEASVSQG